MATFYLYGDINETIARNFNKFARNQSSNTVDIYIHSDGGEFESCCAIVDCMNAMRKRGVFITTIVDGKAYSAGAFIFAFGDKRVVYEHSILMYHSVYWSTHEQTLHNQRNAVEFTEKFYRNFLADMRRHCNLVLDENTLYDKFRDDWWLDSNEALQHGFATDRIV